MKFGNYMKYQEEFSVTEDHNLLQIHGILDKGTGNENNIINSLSISNR